MVSVVSLIRLLQLGEFDHTITIDIQLLKCSLQLYLILVLVELTSDIGENHGFQSVLKLNRVYCT